MVEVGASVSDRFSPSGSSGKSPECPQLDGDDSDTEVLCLSSERLGDACDEGTGVSLDAVERISARRDRPSTANLEAQYSPPPPVPFRPAREEMLTMVPAFRERRNGRKARVVLIRPVAERRSERMKIEQG